MQYNIDNTLEACCFFFSNHSIFAQILSIVKHHICKNFEFYKTFQFHNKCFTVQFLFSLDSRIQIWLQQYEKTPDRDTVNNSLIDFSDDLNKVPMQSFQQFFQK